MKKLIAFLVVVVGIGACVAHAQEAVVEPITVSGINLKNLVANTRAGVFLPLEGGRSFKTIYTPLVWLHSKEGAEYAALDIGAAAQGDMNQGYAFLSIGFRLDNILDRAVGITSWVKTHISAATLPSIEVGIGPVLYQSKIRFGASAALKF